MKRRGLERVDERCCSPAQTLHNNTLHSKFIANYHHHHSQHNMEPGWRLILTVCLFSTISGFSENGFDFDYWYKCWLANNAVMWASKLIPKKWEKKIMKVVRKIENWLIERMKEMACVMKDTLVACCRGMWALVRKEDYPPVLDI